MKEFYKYILTADLLCIGERMKKGNYRPCVKTIPFSSISGALREAYFKREDEVIAVGFLTHIRNQKIDSIAELDMVEPDILVIAPQNRLTGGPREGIAPIRVEYLRDVMAEIFISVSNKMVKNKLDELKNKNQDLSLNLGALNSKGMGRCQLKYEDSVSFSCLKTVCGALKTRIPLDRLEDFGIEKDFAKKNTNKLRYCYLYQPDIKEQYKPNKFCLALKEGSIISAPSHLVEQRKEKL